MLFLGILSIAVTVAMVVVLLMYYNKKKHTINSNRNKIVSRKEYQEELDKREEFIKNTRIEIENLINDFISESQERLKQEEDHEKIKFLLEDIKKDIDLITNSFAWQKVESVDELKIEYQKTIDFMKKNRPTKWIKF